DHQVTGVSVSATGRVFVNFPRWTEDVPISVAEVRPDGSIVPYPDAEWNAWRNSRRYELSPADHFVCVQSVVADHQGHLRGLDAVLAGTDRRDAVRGADRGARGPGAVAAGPVRAGARGRAKRRGRRPVDRRDGPDVGHRAPAVRREAAARREHLPGAPRPAAE